MKTNPVAQVNNKKKKIVTIFLIQYAISKFLEPTDYLKISTCTIVFCCLKGKITINIIE